MEKFNSGLLPFANSHRLQVLHSMIVMNPLYQILSLSILLSIQQKNIDCAPFTINKIRVPGVSSFGFGVKDQQSTLGAIHYSSVQTRSLQSFSANVYDSETKQLANRQNGGYTMDPCRTDSQCAGTRACVDTTGISRPPCNGASRCICAPTSFDFCTTSDQCVEKEGCLQNILGGSACVSREAAADVGYPLIPGTSDPPASPSPAITPALSSCRGGRTFDKCSSNSDCIGVQTCQSLFVDLCFPQVVQTCTSSEICPCGEVCMKDVDKNQFCASKDAVLKRGIPFVNRVNEENPLPPAGSVCIGVNSLKDVPPTDLVYERHQLGHVLCDKEDSCATPGHMVIYDGITMMMSNYCETVKCEKRIMHVNSPKWGRQVKIDSNTEGLVFTAFAARYNTGTEEKILLALVRIGL